MKQFPELTLASTAHDNVEMSHAMLDSFALHVGAPRETIIFDDASRPPYVAPARPELHVRVVRSETALGFCRASDRVLREVQTPYALLVDADVIFLAGDFESGLAQFREGNWAWVNFRQLSFEGVPQNGFEQPLMPAWVFAGGNQLLEWWEKSHPPRLDCAGTRRIAAVDAAHSSCTLVKMEAFRRIGGFDPWYLQCQSDIEISLRFRKRGYGVGVDLGYSVKHAGAGGRSGNPERVLDLYRARLHLYENEFPVSRLYLRPLLFVRHALEVLWFAARGQKDRIELRKRMLKGVWRGYR